MKKSHKVLIACGSVLLAFIIVISVCAGIAHSRDDKTLPTPELSCWMGLIKDDTLIKNLVITGAHDAGTCGISYLAETQDRTTKELLDCGTRYLDLRVTEHKGKYQIYHGPFRGVTLDSVLNDVYEFVTKNSSETVILDFQHFDNGASQGAFDIMQKTLGKILVSNTTDKTDVEFINRLTLGEMRGKCLVVWGDEYEKFENSDVFKRNNDDGDRENCVIHSFYQTSLNKKSSKTYIKEALPKYIDMYKEKGNGMFVLQGQLTDGMFIFGPRFREATHCDNMNEYVKNLAKSAELNNVNIIMRDFVSPSKNAITLKLNVTKGLVKDECTEVYAKMIEANL